MIAKPIVSFKSRRPLLPNTRWPHRLPFLSSPDTKDQGSSSNAYLKHLRLPATIHALADSPMTRIFAGFPLPTAAVTRLVNRRSLLFFNQHLLITLSLHFLSACIVFGFLMRPYLLSTVGDFRSSVLYQSDLTAKCPAAEIQQCMEQPRKGFIALKFAKLRITQGCRIGMLPFLLLLIFVNPGSSRHSPPDRPAKRSHGGVRPWSDRKTRG